MQKARNIIVDFNRRIGLTEGPGQLLSTNRWAYDMNGSGFYVKPDVLMDIGPGRRYWVDGKTSLTGVSSSQQFRNFFEYTGANGGKVATPSGLYSVPAPARKTVRYGRR